MGEDFRQGLTSAMIDIWSATCSCSFVAGLLTNIGISCTSDGRVNYAGDVIYSSTDGGTTASTLIDLMQDYVLSMDQPEVPVEGYETLTVNTDCPIKQQDYYTDENSACLDTSSTIDTLFFVYISLGVIGVILIVVIILAIIIIIV